MSDVDKILDQNFGLIKSKRGVLNATVHEKFVDGKPTGQKAIVVYVEKKLPMAMLSDNEALPKEINGVPVDVVEMVPKGWTVKKTAISQLPPSQQRRIAGGTIKTPKPEAPKGTRPRTMYKTELEKIWDSLVNENQNQGGCGSCTAFGETGIHEMRHLQMFGERIKLSEQHLFTCSGGLCGEGNTVEATLNQALKGICLEEDLPYGQANGKDYACREHIKPGWAARAKRLSSWKAIVDIDEIRGTLMTMPLITVMEVHQSFMNYGGGIYTDLGPSDPSLGYHCIGCIGISGSSKAYKARNSYGEDWGVQGDFWIAYDTCGFDDVMWAVYPSNEPIPDPGPDPTPDPEPEPNPDPLPVPSPCKIARATLILPNAVLAMLGRTGRLDYRKKK